MIIENIKLNKMLQSEINHTSYVLDFLDEGFDSDELSRVLKLEVDFIIEGLRVGALSDWSLVFRANYTNGRQLLISKNRFGTYAKEKYKEIVIPIPIPTLDVATWGVKRKQHVFKEDHYDKIIQNFNVLEIDFSDFDSRETYILDCMRRAIKFSFENGITINKVRLKV